LEDSPTEEDFRLHFEKVVAPRHRIWVAVEGDSIIGFVTATGDAIRNIFVDRRHQRRGIGTDLLQTALQHNPAILLTSTLAANLPARRFYEKNGFVPWTTESHTFPGHQTSIYRRAGIEAELTQSMQTKVV
jgi:GNAT superfamily N-acetyltransferase